VLVLRCEGEVLRYSIHYEGIEISSFSVASLVRMFRITVPEAMSVVWMFKSEKASKPREEEAVREEINKND